MGRDRAGSRSSTSRGGGDGPGETRRGGPGRPPRRRPLEGQGPPRRDRGASLGGAFRRSHPDSTGPEGDSRPARGDPGARLEGNPRREARRRRGGAAGGGALAAREGGGPGTDTREGIPAGRDARSPPRGG